MKASRFLSFIMSLAALSFATTACDDDKKDDDLGAPQITVEPSEIEVDVKGGSETVKLTATRDWTVQIPEDCKWVAVSPDHGEASSEAVTINVTVLENLVNGVEGSSRTGKVTFTCGLVDGTLTVNQKGKEVNYTSISDVLAKGLDTELAAGTVISGVVISNPSLNNFTSKKIVVLQDETAGIELYLSSDSKFARGDKVAADLSGQKISEYKGLKQINGLSPDKVTLLGSDNEIVAKTVDIKDFLANKYESQYVELSGVQVLDSDLSKTWVQNDQHSSINFVDKDGNIFEVRSSKYSSFKSDVVPQGSGSIKGIAAIYDNTIQLIFSDANDYAGLTGERFKTSSSWVDLPNASGEGTEVSPYNVAKSLNIIHSGNIPEDKVYVKGKISKLDEFAADYGNYTYYISDDGTSTNEFMVFRGYYFGGEKFTSADQLKVGDEIVVLGKLIMYNGKTPEVNSGSSVISINGKGDSGLKFSVSSTSISAKAEETSATFNVKANVAWTVTSDNSAYTVEPASGDADATVTVKFAANTASEDKIVKLTVSTTADVATKSYTVTLTHKAVGATDDFSSNVTWTANGDNKSYSEKATINGVKDVPVLKLGTSKVTGSAMLVIPAGTKKISFYGLAWKGKKASVAAEYNGVAIGDAISLAANPGCTDNTPYTINDVTTDSQKTIDIAALNGGNPLPADMTITVKSVKGTDCRVILFGIKAEK